MAEFKRAMKKLLDSQQVQHALDRLYKAVVQQLPKEGTVAVVGIRTRGEILARRIVDRLRSERPGLHLETGVLDITFYRDDLSQRRGAPLVRATEIDFDLDDTWLLLVDDVLQTGRSVRAALDALHDFGRPKIIRLAVLIDRGGRQLPISADFAGRVVNAPAGSRVQVKLKENDGEEGVFIIKTEG
ncbi:MAG: bifunctional pyr operon transcriptional regulator/uracil phosphoribosyltransferase PyrR [Planctomycetota bacterium]|nr:bifunctional pyr operon transcriptional regulator/uracil phosphoribosyltransferase PyrR [Planctomycetota bacterium]